ncbi:DUF1636 family protein [Nostoc sp. MG11]|uniref:DUF1636 family protein n=1 Tax=Nostoc sp. MG11 TaxID=2721166 RepID=UPI001867C308|nr:DUF1636 family protein [Nostoc sp. MG11]
MIKHTLFVCKSCHRSSEERPKNPPFDGDFFIDQLNGLCIQNFSPEELEIQPVGCLWACSQGCVVSICCSEKPTYLFTNLTPEPSAVALLEFLKMYINSSKGAILWKQLPELLQSAIFAQIPPIKL